DQTEVCPLSGEYILYPSHYKKAFAFSVLLTRTSIGFPYGLLSVSLWRYTGLPCSTTFMLVD
ncbi:hypothetical protein, partial [Ruminococcus sp. RTP21484sp1_RTP21281st1_A8_RTP21281_210402]|uniref:hypothetical protein n=1 Tax=Ruminococcus sp. RTP21484sp1_RTP21281st1_A8_RTP21281_210402 TaxID=3141609 RepID=UPI0034A58293